MLDLSRAAMLGRADEGYVRQAVRLGVRVFSLTDAIYEHYNTRGLGWARNRMFIDAHIDRGGIFLLNSYPWASRHSSSQYRTELRYLDCRGYRVSADGLSARRDTAADDRGAQCR
jgi:hypothetical protein